MKLEVGKAYRTRNGQKVTIVEERPARRVYNFVGDNGADYTPSGLFWRDDNSGKYPLDLVAEWDDLENAEFEEETPQEECKSKTQIFPSEQFYREFGYPPGRNPPHFIPPLPSRPDPADHAPTLRDQFAMAALTGLLSDHTMQDDIKEFCKGAYRCADAMMAERAKAGA